MANSGLENVVKAGIGFGQTSQVAEGVDYNKYLNAFLGYLQASGRNPEQFQGLGQNPEQLGRLAEEAAKEEKSNLVRSVSENLESVAEGLSPDQVFDLVQDNKTYRAIDEAVHEAHNSGDSSKLRKLYSDAFGNDPLLRRYILTATDDALLRSALVYLKSEKEQFFKDKLFKEEGEGKDKKLVYDPEKAKGLVTAYVGTFDDKKREEAYFALGQFYTQYFLAKQAAQAKKK